ncbi:PcfJ domain-containing protein [Rhodococcus sp. IEGM1300]
MKNIITNIDIFDDRDKGTYSLKMLGRSYFLDTRTFRISSKPESKKLIYSFKTKRLYLYIGNKLSEATHSSHNITSFLIHDAEGGQKEKLAEFYDKAALFVRSLNQMNDTPSWANVSKTGGEDALYERIMYSLSPVATDFISRNGLKRHKMGRMIHRAGLSNQSESAMLDHLIGGPSSYLRKLMASEKSPSYKGLLVSIALYCGHAFKDKNHLNRVLQHVDKCWKILRSKHGLYEYRFTGANFNNIHVLNQDKIHQVEHSLESARLAKESGEYNTETRNGMRDWNDRFLSSITSFSFSSHETEERDFVRDVNEKLVRYTKLSKYKRMFSLSDKRLADIIINSFTPTDIKNGYIRFMSDVKDILNMMEGIKGHNKKFKPYADSTFKATELRVTQLYNRIGKDNIPFTYKPNQLKLNRTYNSGYEFRLAEESHRLDDVANKLEICVGGYTKPALSSSLFIVNLFKDGKYALCIEVRPDKTIVQVKGVSNNAWHDVPKEWASLVRRYAKDNGLTINTSDLNYNGRPDLPLVETQYEKVDINMLTLDEMNKIYSLRVNIPEHLNKPIRFVTIEEATDLFVEEYTPILEKLKADAAAQEKHSSRQTVQLHQPAFPEHNEVLEHLVF